MSKDDSAEERARAKLQEIEESAAELVMPGDLLFRAGEPTDPLCSGGIGSTRAWWRYRPGRSAWRRCRRPRLIGSIEVR
jgi:hypothetical protein